MRYKYSINGLGHLTVEGILAILPENYFIESDNENLFLITEYVFDTTENDAYLDLQREIDRVFFLTALNIQYELVSIENNTGTSTGISCIQAMVNVVEDIPDNINRQQWTTDNIVVHLRLWYLAYSPHLPLAAKVNLLFQIIEIEYPNPGDYPEYNDSNIPPNPRTESKLLRHLMSHGYGPVVASQLQRYCDFLNLPLEMHDPSNPQFLATVHGRLAVLINEAKETINYKISKL